ncbi:UNVERIFIED_CONTAM: hypothetical protein K2H54_019419 [Gekko kuhli]
MFLYWKKRGAYELETLPTDLVGLDYGMVERFSWSSATDIASDLDGRLCQSLFYDWANRFYNFLNKVLDFVNRQENGEDCVCLDRPLSN